MFKKPNPNLYRILFNLYPPYLGAGIKITHISEDWRELRVRLALRFYNRNIVGVHFGGSLYSMVDPHYMLLLMMLLGDDYYVWDRVAKINFVKATKKTVYATFSVSDEALNEIIENTKNGEKYFANFTVTIKDSEGETIAEAEKTIYVRKKPYKIS